ncbi:MAG: DUF4268 domain-containing protein [Anaerolineae bacterium]|nr:DUF4268 domain-containing protein [Anaerolineae bacterium]
MNKPLGKLKRVGPRTVWQHEAHDFTPWVRDNLAQLAAAVGLDLELVETESKVGNYAVDLYAKELNTGHWVIIENQLAQTDHNHLGQLMAYAAGKGAGVVIWISPDFRDEHRQALEWLNELAGEKVSFFGIEIELLQIDESLPAADFKVVVQPNEWVRAIESSGVSPRMQAYEVFFTALLNKARARLPDLTKAKKAYPQGWFSFPIGRSGFSINPAFAQANILRVELYIDTGDRDKNKAAFDALQQEQPVIEAEFGQALVWERLNEKRAARIYARTDGSIDDTLAHLEELQVWAVEMVERFNRIFRPRVQKLKL